MQLFDTRNRYIFFCCLLVNHILKRIWDKVFKSGLSKFVNVVKSLVSYRFAHIYWEKSLMENFIFCVMLWVMRSDLFLARNGLCQLFCNFLEFVLVVVFLFLIILKKEKG